mgnify:CR=1 FL=1
MENKTAMTELMEIAKRICEMREIMGWSAEEMAEKLVNQDGSSGPHWPMDVFFSVVPKLGGKLEDNPYYNKYALWLIANAHYSDFAKSTSEDMGYQTVDEVPGEKMALSMYKKAVERRAALVGESSL